MNENEQILKKIKTNQILLIVLLVITSLTLVAFIVVGIKGMQIYNEVSPVIEQLEGLDVDAINSAMKTVSEMEGIDFSKLSESLKNIDLESLEKNLDSIDFDGIQDLLSAIDVDKMKEAMDNLASASEMLENVSEKVAPILNWFK